MPGRAPSVGKSAGDRPLVRGFAARDFCQRLAEVCGDARVSSANWRQINAMPASRNIGCTPAARLTSLKLGASPAISRRACDPPVGGLRRDKNSQNCHISDFMADLLDFGHLSSAS
jgi:hypothetical protein